MVEPALPDEPPAPLVLDLTHPEGGVPLVVDTHDGGHVVGVPDADSDADGRPDTVVDDGPGGLLLATDVDGDAHADVVTVVGTDGAAATALRGPDGTVAVPGRDPAWDPAWDRDGGPAPPAPFIDPATGRWTSGP